MTIICAVRERGVGTWIAADQLITATDGSKVGHVRKWVHGNKFAIGIAGSAATIDSVGHHIRKFRHTMSNFEVAQALRAVYKAMGAVVGDREGIPLMPNSFIFATADRVSTFCNEGGGTPVGYDDLAARGSGAPYAEGAWSAMRGRQTAMKAKLNTCVAAACEWDTGCGGHPFIALLSPKGLERKFG